MTTINFKDNSLASDSKHGRDFKISPLPDMLNAAFQQFGIFLEISV
jgi:hypothetical protein